MNIVQFAKMNQSAKMPTKGHQTDAGFDLFYCGTEEIHLSSGHTKLFGTGLKVHIPQGYVMEIKNRSGVAVKQQLVVGACIIDPGYDGEVKINLHNIGLQSQTVKPGDKICQAIFYRFENPMVLEVESEEISSMNKSVSSRLSGGFGSTGMS